MKEIKVPATSANLGPGYDSLGLALNLYNNFKFKNRDDKKIKIKIIDKNNNKKIKIRNQDNLIFKAYKKYFNYLKIEIKGIEIIEEMYTPPARGLGSSSAAIIGGLAAAVVRTNKLISEKELIQLAVELEKHPDNVIPALIGGLCINFYCSEGYDYYKIDLDQNLDFILIVPDYELQTEKLRKVLPEKLKYAQTIHNLRSISLLTAAFINKDYYLLKTAIKDQIHQPYRKKFIKLFDQLIEAAYKEGAFAAALSGAGPTMLAISNNSNSQAVAEAMKKEFKTTGLKAESFILKAENNSLYQSLEEELY